MLRVFYFVNGNDEDALGLSCLVMQLHLEEKNIVVDPQINRDLRCTVRLDIRYEGCVLFLVLSYLWIMGIRSRSIVAYMDEVNQWIYWLSKRVELC